MVSISFGEIGHYSCADLRVDAGIQARCTRPLERIEGLRERPGNSSDFVVQRCQTVEGNTHPTQSCLHRFLQALRGKIPSSRLSGAIDSVRSNGPDNLSPIVSQVGFATNQGYFSGSQAGQGFHDLETIGGAQFLRAPMAGARSAMQAL